MFSKLNAHKNQKGFTLIEILITMTIIGILASVAIPSFAQYRDRAHESVVKVDLHNIYLSCKAYWGDTTPQTDCTVEKIKEELYGFLESEKVSTTFTNGTESLFSVVGSHEDTGNTSWTIDANGNIVKGVTPAENS